MSNAQDNSQCAAHTAALIKQTEKIADVGGKVDVLTATFQAYIKSSAELETRRDTRSNQHSADIKAIKESQDSEVKYWRIGKRIILFAGVPAILGWIIYIAGFFKEVP